MNYWPHQKRFIKQNPDRAILAWEMRTGKTDAGAAWIDNKRRGVNTFIICPKQVKKDWIKRKTRAIVLTKEEFKKYDFKMPPTAIVVDEAHYFASALFLRKGNGRSQLSEKLYTLVKKNPEMHVLLLTATPIRQDAWSLHTLLCYIGEYYDWKEWRERFFDLTRLPFLAWPIYVPKATWRIDIRPYIRKHCNIISLRDIVDDLPAMIPEFISVKHAQPYKPPEDEVVTWVDEHRYEQEGKYKEILKLGYRKVLVVANYTAQIDELKSHLEKDRPVFILDGRTKDADAVKNAAQEADDCYFIVQSSMGFGFDGWMFGAIVFASMSHSCLNHTQMLGRLRHLEHLKTVNAYYLIGGRWDKRIYDTIEKGKDFNPHEYESA